MSDFRVILRTLLRTPLFTLTAVLSLGLGIGANAAMFSMLDRLLLRALPVASPEDLVFLYHPGPVQGSQSQEESGSPSFSYPQLRGLQASQTPFTGIAGTRTQASTSPTRAWRRLAAPCSSPATTSTCSASARRSAAS